MSSTATLDNLTEYELTAAKNACKAILIRLKTISDQRASRFRTDGLAKHNGHNPGLRTRATQPLAAKVSRYADSSLPDGMALETNGDHAPSKQLSLYWHYRWRMTRALDSGEISKAHRLVWEARCDYEEHTGHRRPLRFEHHDGAVAHLLREFVGVPADRAAIEMRTPKESFRDALIWVRRQRVRNGYDPELGEVRESDERTRRIFTLAEQGVKQAVIAEELGISRPRVSQILAGKR